MCQAEVCWVQTNAASAHGCINRVDLLTNQFWKTGEQLKASKRNQSQCLFNRGGRDWKSGHSGCAGLGYVLRRSPSKLEVGVRHRQLPKLLRRVFQQPRVALSVQRLERRLQRESQYFWDSLL